MSNYLEESLLNYLGRIEMLNYLEEDCVSWKFNKNGLRRSFLWIYSKIIIRESVSIPMPIFDPQWVSLTYPNKGTLVNHEGPEK